MARIEYEIHIVWSVDDEEFFAGADSIQELSPYIRQCEAHGDRYKIYSVTREELIHV